MVHVVPPEGWEPEPAAESVEAAGSDAPAAEGVDDGGPWSGSAEVTAAGVGDAGADAAAEAGGEPAGMPAPMAMGVAPAELAWRKWLLLGAGPAAGLAVVLGLCSIFFWRDRPGEQPEGVAQQSAETVLPERPMPPEQRPDPSPPELGRSGDSDSNVPQQTAATDGDAGTQESAEVAELTPDDPQPDQAEPDQPQPDQPQPDPAEPSSEGLSDSEDEGLAGVLAGVPVERLPPMEIDLRARLMDTIPEIQLRGVPLAEAVDLLASLSTVPMTFDPEAMQQLGVGLRDPVSVELAGATVGQILDEVLASRGMAAAIDNGQVLLTSPADRRQRYWERRYTVSDLTDGEPAAVGELAATVERLISPDSWQAAGGQGTIEADDDALAVTQTSEVHHQVLVFCERLRNARGKPLRSRYSPERFSLQTRLDRARAVLGRSVSANFREPAPLIEVLAYLGTLAEADVLIDRLGLAAAELSDRTEVSLNVEGRPLGEVLAGLLGPLGLAYRVIDGGTLQVTTQQTAAGRQELEFYPVANLLADGRTGPQLAQQINERLAASTQSEPGGAGVVEFDAPSAYLIVLQSQPIQRQVQRLLADLAN